MVGGRQQVDSGKYHKMFSYFLVLSFFNILSMYRQRHYQNVVHNISFQHRGDIGYIEKCLSKFLLLLGPICDSNPAPNQLLGIDIIFKILTSQWSISGMWDLTEFVFEVQVSYFEQWAYSITYRWCNIVHLKLFSLINQCHPLTFLPFLIGVGVGIHLLRLVQNIIRQVLICISKSLQLLYYFF